MHRPTFIFDSNGDLLSVDPEGKPPDLEPTDVVPGETTAFDIDGNVLSVVVKKHDVVLEPTGRSDLPALLELARRQARAFGIDPKAAGDDLLLAVANRELQWMWEQRWPKRPRWVACLLHGGDQPPPPFTRA